MPWNGSGTFSVYTPGTPYVNGTTIDETVANAVNSDFATGLTNCVAKDGQNAATANLPMGTFRHTGVGNATTRAAATYASAADVQDGTLNYLTGVAGTNTITATAAISMTAYKVGQRFWGIAAASNTGATTLNLNSIGAGAVQSNGAALVGGEIQSGQYFEVEVSATTPVFQLIANGAALPFIDSLPLVHGSADPTKKVRIEVDGLTTATTRVWTAADIDIAVGKQPTRTVYTTGSGTYTTPTGATRIDVQLLGPGGGGAAATTNSGANGSADTTFGASLTAGKGTAGSTAGGAGGAGGTATGGDINIPGGSGSAGFANGGGSAVALTGGAGGNSFFGGGAGAAAANAAGGNAATNSGAGGAGGGNNGATTSGGGGGAGGYVRKLITSPSATYAYAVGAGGNGGSAGAFAGGNGAAGIIIIDEYYN